MLPTANFGPPTAGTAPGPKEGRQCPVGGAVNDWAGAVNNWARVVLVPSKSNTDRPEAIRSMCWRAVAGQVLTTSRRDGERIWDKTGTNPGLHRGPQ